MENMRLEDIKNPPKGYRAVPFWSWNSKLVPEETRRQAGMMDDAGCGGFFMHARGGLTTPYMGEEWFANVTAAVEEAEARGMAAWAYDENGWPSGFGDGRVNGRGLAFQQKYLRIEEGDASCERTICHAGGYHLYYDVNPFYVDTLNAEATAVFIDEIYRPYYERYGTRIAGFFTDEPQISRDGIPWSFTLPDEYQAAYGEGLLPLLPALFYPVEGYERVRLNFWRLVTRLFSEHYLKPIYDWCEARGLKLTGHMVMEDTMLDQVTTNGAVMPHYEYMHVPGVDLLCRYPATELLGLQLASAGHQLGKKQLLTESFALCGHNVSFDELRRVLESQMSRGVNLLCPHLEGYSLAGIRKRDYPPAMYYQQPWWPQYRTFLDGMARIGMLLAEGEAKFDTLVLHPQSTAWVCFDNGENAGLQACEDAFLEVIRTLESKHILFHLGDETLMERHARVEGDALVLGTQRYTKIVLPPQRVLFDSTKQLLAGFVAGGGRIVTAEELPVSGVTDNGAITYTRREFPDFTMHYFVNTTGEPQQASFGVQGQRLDILTGDLVPFGGTYAFEACDSLVLIARAGDAPLPAAQPVRSAIPLDGAWRVVACEDNAMTLDHCDYYFDGQLEEENGYVLNIQNRACALGRPVRIRMVYHVEAAYLPDVLHLVCETPEIYRIAVNGNPLVQTDCGYFRDKSFRRLDISGMLALGHNEIVLETDFWQSDAVYENLERAKQFEGELNKLHYDREIEGLFLVGRFGVGTSGTFTPLERHAVRYQGGFVLTEPPETVSLTHLEQQGFPFFAGSMTVEQQITLPDTNRELRMALRGINAVAAAVNGMPCGEKIFSPFVFEVADALRAGDNTVTLTLTNNLRNLMGPHYLREGESFAVGPSSFYNEPCIWHGNPGPERCADPCFVEVSLLERT